MRLMGKPIWDWWESLYEIDGKAYMRLMGKPVNDILFVTKIDLDFFKLTNAFKIETNWSQTPIFPTSCLWLSNGEIMTKSYI